MKYICSLIVVENIQRSRDFYEKTLKQKVQYDFGANITFEGGFAIHFKEHFEEITKGTSSRSISFGSNSFELYFETGEIEEILNKLKDQNVDFVHEIQIQPWGQKVIRFYDPDRHMVEIGETMEAVVIRFYQQGNSSDEIVKRSSMPKEFVENTIKNFNTGNI